VCVSVFREVAPGRPGPRASNRREYKDLRHPHSRYMLPILHGAEAGGIGQRERRRERITSREFSQPAYNAMLACASKRSIAGRSFTVLVNRFLVFSQGAGPPMHNVAGLMPSSAADEVSGRSAGICSHPGLASGPTNVGA
jgi:hypothetical protein